MKDNQYFAVLDKYIDRLLSESAPHKPLWNIEYIESGRAARWNYIDGCMITALLSLFDETNNTKYLEFSDNFIDYYIDENGKILGYSPDEYNIDNINEGRVLFDLYKHTKKQKYLRAIETVYSQIKTHPRNGAGSFWHKKIYPNQVWLDGLYMAQVFYTRYELELNGKKNINDILSQFENVKKYMYNSNARLFHHGFDYSKSAFWCDENGLSRSFWLRAEGWFTVALVDVIGYLQAGGVANELASLLRLALDGIICYLDKDENMFYQVIDCGKKQGNYLETSGSAMIAYALLKGARLGVLTEDYAQIGRRIFEGICKKYLSEKDGILNLGGICLVAGLGPDNNRRRNGSFEYYVSEPIVQNDAKGVAPLLLAYTEMRKFLKISAKMLDSAINV